MFLYRFNDSSFVSDHADPIFGIGCFVGAGFFKDSIDGTCSSKESVKGSFASTESFNGIESFVGSESFVGIGFIGSIDDEGGFVGAESCDGSAIDKGSCKWSVAARSGKVFFVSIGTFVSVASFECAESFKASILLHVPLDDTS